MSILSRIRSGLLLAVSVPFGIYAINNAIAALRMMKIEGLRGAAFIPAALAFGCSGATVFLIDRALRGFKSFDRDDALRAAHPNEPWLWKEEWVARRIPDNGPPHLALLWGFAFLWNVIAAPILVLLPAELDKGNQLAWLGVVFPIAGAILVLGAILTTLRSLRFRRSTLVLDSVPVPIGGMLRGTVESPHMLDNATSVMTRLVAVEIRRSGKSTIETTTTHDEREVDPALIRRSGNGAVIPVEIAVPADVDPTEVEQHARKLLWRVVVDAEVPGLDYSATFDVPVFRTVFSDFRPHGLTSQISAPRNPRSYVERSGPEGPELYFPPFRAPGVALFSLLFTIGWLGVIAFVIAIEVPRAIPIVFGLFAIPIVMSNLELLFGSQTLVVAPDRLIIRRRLLFTSEKSIPRTEIAAARAAVATQGGARPYYHIEVQRTSGRAKRVVKYIRSKREADWVASRIAPLSSRA